MGWWVSPQGADPKLCHFRGSASLRLSEPIAMRVSPDGADPDIGTV